jgi:hypothetical protein
MPAGSSCPLSLIFLKDHSDGRESFQVASYVLVLGRYTFLIGYILQKIVYILKNRLTIMSGYDWVFDKETGILIVRGDGPMMDFGRFLRDRSPWRDVRVKHAVIKDGITSIGNNAFYGCKDLESVEIPGTVTSIGHGAFQGCASLLEVDIPDSVNIIGPFAFYRCKKLKKVELPHGLETIPNDAFALCKGLETASLPKTLRSIGDHAFYECTSLQSAEVPRCIESIGQHAFANCISLDLLVRSDKAEIGPEAFEGVRSVVVNSLPPRE